MRRLAFLVTVVFAMAATHAAPRKRAVQPAVKSVRRTPAKKPVRTAPARPLRPGPNWSVAFSPDGARIAVGGYKRVTLYDAATGARIADWTGPGDAVRGLAFSRDGRYLAAGTGVPAQSGGVLVYDAATGKPARTLTNHLDTVEAVAFAGNRLLSAADDEKVCVTNITTGKRIGVLAEHVGRCLSVAVPVVTSEADGGDIFVTGGADSVIKVWDAQTRRVVVNFDQCASPVWSLAFLPRPGRFVAASGDGRLRVFGVRADPDGRAGDGQRTGFVARTIDAHAGTAYAVAASPDGKWIVSGGADKKAVIWREDGGKLREMAEAAGDIYAVAVSPDSRRVAAASLDGKTRVYNIEDGKLLLELPGGAPKPPAPAQEGTPKPGGN